MKSSIKIDFTGISEVSNAFRPVIRVRIEESEDPRDGLLSSFFQSLGHNSNWLSVLFDYQIMNTADGNPKHITISPVTPDELPETLALVRSRIDKDAQTYPAKLIENRVFNIRETENSTDDTIDHRFIYSFHVTKSLKGLREGVLKEAIEEVINNPENFIS